MTASFPAGERQPGKLRIGMYWASSCGGCDISLLEIAEHLLELIEVADVVFWPCVADFKYRTVADYPDGHIDVCLFNGGIRSSEQEEIARLLRRKSRTLAAYGACAMDGGIPALANLKSPGEIYDAAYHSNPTLQNPGTDRTGRAVVHAAGRPHASPVLPAGAPPGGCRRVDYQIPGCPPVGTQVWKVLQAVVAGEVPARDRRRPRRLRQPIGLRRVPPREAQDPREGVQAAAPGDPRAELVPARAGIRVPGRRPPAAAAARCARRPNCTCRGCYGAAGLAADQGTAMLSALGSVIDATTEDPRPRDCGRDRRSDRDVLPLQPGVEHAQGPPVKHARSER